MAGSQETVSAFYEYPTGIWSPIISKLKFLSSQVLDSVTVQNTSSEAIRKP